MGELLHFPIERALRSRAAAAVAPVAPVAPTFFFDVTSPACYLIAERVERTLGDVEWVAVDGSALGEPIAPRGRELTRLRNEAEARAAEMRLPIVWPDRFPIQAPGVLRAAAFACELGAGPAFALAASRLAFCGGYDLDDPAVIAEAAGAASVPFGVCLSAASERWRDDELRETARSLSNAGVQSVPAFAVGEHWLEGEAVLAEAVAMIALAEPARRRLAPAG